MPLGVYKKITALDPKDEEGNLKLLALLEGVTYNDILNAPIAEVKQKIQKLDFLNKKPKKHLVKLKYRLGDKTYCFDCTAKSITTAQFIDFGNTKKEDITGALSIFLIPEGHRYNEGYELEDSKLDIDNYLSVEEALSICDFFTTLSELYVRRILRRAKRNLRKAKKHGATTEEAERIVQDYLNCLSISGFQQ